jgi:carbonic anhydrase
MHVHLLFGDTGQTELRFAGGGARAGRPDRPPRLKKILPLPAAEVANGSQTAWMNRPRSGWKAAFGPLTSRAATPIPGRPGPLLLSPDDPHRLQENAMTIIDKALRANDDYARDFALGDLAMPPRRHLAVVACMDARLTVEQMLGLDTGDAHVIRNAGGLATEDAIRSLIISHHLLGTQEFMVINHTECGMLTFQDTELRQRLERQTGRQSAVPEHFHAFNDLEANVRKQVRTIRDHPWVPETIPVRGFVYDVRNGRLTEVT